MANQEHITIRHAVDRYINAKSAVLSPSTVAGYIRYRNLYLQSIYDKYIDEITQEEFQIAVNKEACLYSPKTLRNACGLVKSAISMFIERDFKITLPQRIRPSFYIPEKEEVKKIYEKIKGTGNTVFTGVPMRASPIGNSSSYHSRHSPWQHRDNKSTSYGCVWRCSKAAKDLCRVSFHTNFRGITVKN